MNDSELKEHFEDTERARMLIRKLVELLIGTFDDRGKSYNLDDLHRIFMSAITNAPAPDKALLNVYRMTEASFGVSFARDLVRYPVLMDLAVKIGMHSQFLSDIIVRDPELFRWLTTSDVLSITKTHNDFVGELEKQIEPFDKRENQFNVIRRFYRREILRIGLRDLLAQESFEIIVGEISDLAEAISAVVFNITVDDIIAKYKVLPIAQFTIIGLGKFGGRELNYSSDIDIMFVMGDDEKFLVDSGRKMHAIDLYTAVADKWISVMTEHTKEGYLYRVDSRLRPDGKAGPLVRSAQGYRNYYETRGELWERQMLIKARPIAGDIAFGWSFLESLQPFIYPATLFQSPRQTIARMKTRIEKNSADQANIKLFRGGIRDIEFIVQALQLLYGGKDKQIRSNTTLTAIDLLHARNHLTNFEHQALRSAYIFFRKLEHRVQLDENIQSHSIPVDVQERNRFARLAGYETLEKFDKEINEYRKRVRNIFHNVFGGEDESSYIDYVLSQDDAAQDIDLSEFGFTNQERANELLKKLALGITSPGIGDHDIQTKEIFRSIAPGLLQDFSSAINPDRALANFLSIVQAYPHPYAFYVAMQQKSIRKALVKVCGYSNKLALQLAKYPEDLELFINNIHIILGSDSLIDSEIIHYPDRFLNFAIHARFMNDKCRIDEVHRTISFIAMRRIREVLYEIYRDYKLGEPPIAIVSLGKLSGDELGPGADLDLIVLFEPGNGMDTEEANKIAKELIQRCMTTDDLHIPFEIDMRLRPEGRSGPLAVEVNGYELYLVNRASLWERQSLVRARVIESPQNLTSRIHTIIENYVYNRPLDDGWIGEIRNMRYRTESRSKMNRHNYIDVKTGPGGLMDIEFLVQSIQLHAGRTDTSLRLSSTRAALFEMRELGFCDKNTVDFLWSAYDKFRYLEYFNRIYAEDSSNSVPTGAEEQNILMRMFNIREDPVSYFVDLTEKVREVFSKLMNQEDLIKK